MNIQSMKLSLISTLTVVVGCWALTAQPESPEAPGPGPQPPPRRGGPPRPPRPLPLVILERYDTNQDGKLDEQERAQLHQQIETAALQPRPPQDQPPGPRGPAHHFGPPKEILDQYDLNQDGRLDETEHAAVKADIDAGKLAPPPHPPWPRHFGPPPSPAQILEKHDLDGDGKLDVTELSAFLKPPPPPQ